TIFIVLYFSEDWFHSWGMRGKQFREVCRRFADFFWFAYPFSFGAFTFIAAFSFLIPQQYQSVYWTLGIYALTALGVTLFEIITGEKDSSKHWRNYSLWLQSLDRVSDRRISSGSRKRSQASVKRKDSAE